MINVTTTTQPCHVVRFNDAPTFLGELSPRADRYRDWMRWEKDKREAAEVVRLVQAPAPPPREAVVALDRNPRGKRSLLGALRTFFGI